MTYRGHVENGLVVPDGPMKLPEGAEVTISLCQEPKATEAESEEDIPSLYERLKPVMGKAQGLPPDAATNVDHYLYGLPKK